MEDYGLRKTESFMWNVQKKESRLGLGATGSVFKCRRIKDGAQFAAKVLTERGHQRPRDVIFREVEILKNLEHPNIVRLIAVEREKSGSLVLFMELCGKSLLNILQQPENVYGLPEEDYKAVVHDITRGMQYLKDQSVIHRDVKPGNVLQTCDLKTGKFIYKIGDFGAARILQDDGEFESIYGTEAYLHPDIYKKAVMHYSPGGTFNNTVDLWSLGVTYYHLACGRLPFVPYLANADKGTMYKMLSEKPQGSISCRQLGRNGNLQYSNELPSDSRISKGLRTLITPVLQGLMETNPKKMISHEQFFQDIYEIVSMKVIHVFVSRTSNIHKIYMNKQHTLSHLQDHLALVTGIKEAEQQLYYNGKRFQPECNDCIEDYPTFTMEDPLILISSHFIMSKHFEQKKFPSLNYRGGDGRAHKSDSDFSEMYANCAYTLFFEAETIEVECQAIYKVQNLFKCVTKQCLELERLQCQHIQHQAQMDFETLTTFDKMMSIFRPRDQENSDSKAAEAQYLKIKSLAKDCLERIQLLFEGNISDDVWKEGIQRISGCIRAKDLIGCVNVINEIDATFKKLRDRALSNFDEIAVKSDRTRLVDTYTIMYNNIQGNYQGQRNILHDALTDWLKNVLEKRGIVSKMMENLVGEFTNFLEDFSKLRQQYLEKLGTYANDLIRPINQDDLTNIVQENTKILASFDQLWNVSKLPNE